MPSVLTVINFFLSTFGLLLAFLADIFKSFGLPRLVAVPWVGFCFLRDLSPIFGTAWISTSGVLCLVVSVVTLTLDP